MHTFIIKTFLFFTLMCGCTRLYNLFLKCVLQARSARANILCKLYSSRGQNSLKTVSDLALSSIKKGLPRSINSFNMASVYQVEISVL